MAEEGGLDALIRLSLVERGQSTGRSHIIGMMVVTTLNFS